MAPIGSAIAPPRPSILAAARLVPRRLVAGRLVAGRSAAGRSAATVFQAPGVTVVRRLVTASAMGLMLLALWTVFADVTLAQDSFFSERDEHGLIRGSGGYLAWWKLLIIAVLFSVWVGLADYANREALRLADYLQTKAEVWNPIFIVCFLLGLISVFSIPWFWAGLPLYLLAAFVPLIVFFVVRNKQVEPALRKTVSASGKIAGPMQLVKEQPKVVKATIEFIPEASPSRSPQEILFHARQVPAFNDLGLMIEDALRQRADVMAIICSREKAMVQMQIDGLWHPKGEIDTQFGQAVIHATQIVAGLDPQKNNQNQNGNFRVKADRNKTAIRFTSQPAKADFRGVFRFESASEKVRTYAELGMQPNQIEIVKQGLAGDGFYVVSSSPGQGVTTMWQSSLMAADRWTRDWFSIVPDTDKETVMENVTREEFKSGDIDAAISIVARLGLRQAGGYIVPDLQAPKLVDYLLNESKTEGRKTITRFVTKNAAEALLRTFAAAGDRKSMATALKGAVYQRLVRKLCTHCRVRKPVAPDLIKKLGGDPLEQDYLYSTPDRPAELPKDYQPCPVCFDIGYVGRTGLFEIIQMNPALSKTLLTQPKIDALTQVARKTGSPNLLQSGFPLVVSGVTTLEELKRVSGP